MSRTSSRQSSNKPLGWRICVGLVAGLLALPSVHAKSRKASSGVADQLAFGVKMAQQGLWNEALFRFEQAEKLESQNARILNNLAVASEAVGDFDRALEYYERCLKLNSKDPQARGNYTHFIEFYQSYEGSQDVESAESAESDDRGEQPEPDLEEKPR